MPLRRALAVVSMGLGLVGASLVFGLKPAEEATPAARAAASTRVLDPAEFSVILRLGVGDSDPRPWDGKVSIDRGEVVRVEGERFREGDAVQGRDAWKARSLPVRRAAAKPKAAVKKKAVVNHGSGGPGNAGPSVTPALVVATLKAPADATLTVATRQGEFRVRLDELAGGASRSFLDGRAEAQRVAAAATLADSTLEEDFPAAVSDGSGGLWVVYVAHTQFGSDASTAYDQRPTSFANLAPKGGGDSVKLVHVAGGKPGETVDITPDGRDVWRPTVALDRQGRVVVVHAEQRDGDFELYRTRFDPKDRRTSGPDRLTTAPGADCDPVLATGPDGTLWLAWQAWREGQARVMLSRADAELKPVPAGDGGGNEWSPALAVDARGNPWVAHDTYAAGNYDVRLRGFNPDGTPRGEPVVVAGSTKYETHPSLAVDGRGRVWIAYEERTDNWGKDAPNLVAGEGSTLYRRSIVRVRCLDGERLVEAPSPVGGLEATDPLREFNSLPRLATDDAGRLWLAFRHRLEAIWGANAVMVVGAVWLEYVTALTGPAWTPPTLVPASDNLLDNRPALVAPLKGAGPVLLVYSSDGRLRHELEHSPELTPRYYSHSGTPPGLVDNDLFMAAVAPPPIRPGEPTLTLVTGNEADAPPAAAVHPNEAADVARLRSYRVPFAGKPYRLMRGDFHRHTELSQDGGSDGTLEDMWRYAIDAAGFDWMGNADHDNGGGKEYTWWLVQKTTDLYHSPRLATLFTYERSNPYPHGHRNVMFDHRGVRTLPRLVMGGQVVDEDTAMLYDYLKEHGGICASHTSATGMGTDWRDLRPVFEPMVEIFQGHRNSYEYLGAPRAPRRPGEAIGGWKPLGMVWNALAMHYRIGFLASSDHISTHISYAIAISEGPTRASVLDAFRRRHCYGATDNIVLDVRTADNRHMMGDEFDAPRDGPVRLKVFVQGTRPIARLDIIKDFLHVYTTEPKTDRVSLEWADGEVRPPGTSWYYVRAIQDDGQIAWGSPMWIHSYAPPTAP